MSYNRNTPLVAMTTVREACYRGFQMLFSCLGLLQMLCKDILLLLHSVAGFFFLYDYDVSIIEKTWLEQNRKTVMGYVNATLQ